MSITRQQRRKIDEAVERLTKGAIYLAHRGDSEPYRRAWGDLDRLLDSLTDWSTAPAPVGQDA